MRPLDEVRRRTVRPTARARAARRKYDHGIRLANSLARPIGNSVKHLIGIEHDEGDRLVARLFRLVKAMKLQAHLNAARGGSRLLPIFEPPFFEGEDAGPGRLVRGGNAFGKCSE